MISHILQFRLPIRENLIQVTWHHLWWKWDTAEKDSHRTCFNCLACVRFASPLSLSLFRSKCKSLIETFQCNWSLLILTQIIRTRRLDFLVCLNDFRSSSFARPVNDGVLFIISSSNAICLSSSAYASTKYEYWQHLQRRTRTVQLKERMKAVNNFRGKLTVQIWRIPPSFIVTDVVFKCFGKFSTDFSNKS